jgi:hypothetical protein
MPFIGNQPALSFTSFAKQDFTTSATTSYTLDNSVANANELALFINFVRQEPTTAYSASGTTLTLTEATSSSDDMYCVYLGKAVQTVTPPNNSVTNAMLGETITVANGGTGATTLAGAGLSNTPAFEARLSADQGLTDNTLTKLLLATENFDTDNCYDNSTNYRFTPTVAGKYFVYLNVGFIGSGGINDSSSQIYRNNSPHIIALNNDSALTQQSQFCCGVVDMNGTSDYVEAYVNNDVAVSSTCIIDSDNNKTVFGAYKLIGV